jgi:hypothetical protein
MTRWYLEVRKLIRDIAAKSMDALAALETEDEAAARPIKEYLKTDYKRLQELRNEQVEGRLPTYLGRHIGFAMSNDFRDILRQDLPELEAIVDGKLLESAEERGDLGFENLLHPIIVQSSYETFRNGHRSARAWVLPMECFLCLEFFFGGVPPILRFKSGSVDATHLVVVTQCFLKGAIAALR